jgi:cold shock CspA family protein
MKRKTGVVITFSKTFGRISVDRETDTLFVHQTQISVSTPGAYRSLCPGQRCSFAVGVDGRGRPMAIDVQLIGD